MSNFEAARYPWFAKLPIVVEDAIRDKGGNFSSSEIDAVHVICDRTIVSAQNVNSTRMAIHCLLYLLKQGR